MVSQNLIQCFEDIYHDKTTEFERPGKMQRANRSEHSVFSKQIINNNFFNDSPLEDRIGVLGFWQNPCTPSSLPLPRFITLVTDSDNHVIEIIFTLTVFNNFYCYVVVSIFVLFYPWTKTFRTSMELSASVNFPVVHPYSKSNIVSGYMDFEIILVPHMIFTLTIYYNGYW